ncbi:MAG: hypothetical protein AAF656_04790 [Planctomycetota bacterium]
MNNEKFDELVTAKPFQPFAIVTPDGSEIEVKSPEYAWRVPKSRIVYVASDEGAGRCHVIDWFLVPKVIVEGSFVPPSSIAPDS